MNYDSHPGLRAQLLFEEQKHGIPLHWSSYVPDYLLDRRYRPEITVIGMPNEVSEPIGRMKAHHGVLELRMASTNRLSTGSGPRVGGCRGALSRA